jgi:hypothetical protein
MVRHSSSAGAINARGRGPESGRARVFVVEYVEFLAGFPSSAEGWSCTHRAGVRVCASDAVSESADGLN